MRAGEQFDGPLRAEFPGAARESCVEGREPARASAARDMQGVREIQPPFEALDRDLQQLIYLKHKWVFDHGYYGAPS